MLLLLLLLVLLRTCPLPQQEGGLKGSLRLAQGLHNASFTSGYSMMLTAAATTAAAAAAAAQRSACE
jgi:hypothetical protein